MDGALVGFVRVRAHIVVHAATRRLWTSLFEIPPNFSGISSGVFPADVKNHRFCITCGLVTPYLIAKFVIFVSITV